MLYRRACCPVAKTRGRSPAGASAGKSQEMPPAPAGPRGVVVRDARLALTPHASSASASHRAALSGSASLACCLGVSRCPASALPGAPPRRTSGSAGAWLADAQVACLKPRGVCGSPCGRPSCSTQTYFFSSTCPVFLRGLSGESFKGLCVGGEMPCSFGRPVWSCRL